MDADKLAQEIVEEVQTSLDEESKEMQASNVSDKRSDADKLEEPVGDEMDGEENSGSDSKSKQNSSTNKYKGGVNEEKEIGSDVEDDEDKSDNTVANTDAVHTSDSDHNDTKRDKDLSGKTGMVKEEDEMGDEEEPEDEYGEDSIRQKVEEHFKSEEGAAAIREHIAALFAVEGENELSEEYTKKATTIFETAINERTKAITDIVVEQNTKIISEMREQLEEKFNERVSLLENQADEYLTHVVEEWVEENRLEVEKGLRTEITESFMSDFFGLLNEHNISVPEEKYDVLEEMAEKVDSLEQSLNESKEKEAKMSAMIKEEKRQRLFLENTQDLTMTERERLANLSSHVLFEDEDSYSEELSVIKESYINTTSSNQESETAIDLNEAESETAPKKYSNPQMQSLVESMSNFKEVDKD